jgi:hypothetical protein
MPTQPPFAPQAARALPLMPAPPGWSELPAADMPITDAPELTPPSPLLLLIVVALPLTPPTVLLMVIITTCMRPRRDHHGPPQMVIMVLSTKHPGDDAAGIGGGEHAEAKETHCNSPQVR